MNMNYPNSLQALNADLKKAPESKITHLAIELIERAKYFDISHAQNIRAYPQYIINGELIKRDKDNPVEYTHPSVLGSPGSDTKEKPLGDDEKWNKGRRATNTGATYIISKDGRPTHPYLEKTGITGQGTLWQYGPNHAIDNGILTIEKDNYGIPTLYTIGINRKDSPDRASLSGGFVKFEIDEHNNYIINKEAIINSKAEEFFEEMLSGSVTLREEYEDKVYKLFHDTVMQRMEERTSSIDFEKLEVIKEQSTTHVKMEQAMNDNPELMPRLKETFAEAKECFAGPILNAGRTTDNSWIESRLSWIFLSNAKWDHIIGSSVLRLSAGDDADSLRFDKIDANLIKNSDTSHTAMFAFMTASFLLDSQEKGRKLHPCIIQQAEDMSNQLKLENSKLSLKL